MTVESFPHLTSTAQRKCEKAHLLRDLFAAQWLPVPAYAVHLETRPLCILQEGGEPNGQTSWSIIKHQHRMQRGII